jgi:phage shock protein A
MPRFSVFAKIVQHGLEVLLTPAEDPRAMVVDAAAQQRRMLARVRQSLAENTALHEKLEARAAQLAARGPQLEAQARQALRAGRDDLARLALQQQQVTEAEAGQLRQQALAVQAEAQGLAIVEQRLLAQSESLQARQSVLAARTAATEAQARLGETAYGIADEWTAQEAALEQAELYADYLAARASALDELTAQSTDTAPAVEEKLAALKRELGVA